MVLRANWLRGIAIAVALATAAGTILLGSRTYRSFDLLQSAYAVGAPKTSGIRGWMTLKHVAATYRVPEATLSAGLGLPADGDGDQNLSDKNLKELAEAAKVPPLQYVQRVQRIIAASAPATSDANGASPGWLAATTDRMLTGLLVYGYAVLGLILVLAAVGLPLPSGFAMALVGSLAAQGRMDLMSAGAVAVAASVVGDGIGYAIGRLISPAALAKHGRWIAFTPARQTRVQSFFDRWGMLTVFITRTFVSYLSSVANLFAGVSRFGAARFLASAALGRLTWAVAYLGLGYLIGSDLDAATAFLTNVSLLLLMLALCVGSGLFALRIPASLAP